MGSSTVPSLIDICIKAAAASKLWTVQRRRLQYLPDHAANKLFALLLQQQSLTTAPLVELFKDCVTEASIRGSPAWQPGQEWLLNISRFKHLESLQLLALAKLKDKDVEHLAALGSTLQVLSLKACNQVTTKAAPSIAQLTNLRKLDLSDTSIGVQVCQRLTALTRLTSLDLGGQPTTDACCASLAQHLTRLQHLSLWGSQVTDAAVAMLADLRHLSSLDLSWTPVRVLPAYEQLQALHMAHCTIEEAWHSSAQLPGQLKQLHLQHARLEARAAVAGVISSSSASLELLDLAHTQPPPDLACLSHATALHTLDLSHTPTTDADISNLASCSTMRKLSLAGTSVAWQGVAQLLALPSLQDLSLAAASRVDDEAFSWLQQLTGLTRLDLSGTAVTGVPPSEVAPEPAGPVAAGAGAQEAAQLAGAAAAAAADALVPGFQNIWLPDPAPAATQPAAAQPTAQPAAVQLTQGWALLAQLVDLDLTGSRLTAAGCQALAVLAGAGMLRRLQLGGPGVDNSALKAVARLGSLQKLRLLQAAATDAGLAQLSAVQELRVLLVEGCLLITPGAVAELAAQLPAARQVLVDGALLRLPRRGRASGGATHAGGAPDGPAGVTPGGMCQAGRSSSGQAQQEQATRSDAGGSSRAVRGRGGGGRRQQQEALARARAEAQALLHAFDERYVYSREELWEARRELLASAAGEEVQRAVAAALQALPHELRLDLAW